MMAIQCLAICPNLNFPEKNFRLIDQSLKYAEVKHLSYDNDDDGSLENLMRR